MAGEGAQPPFSIYTASPAAAMGGRKVNAPPPALQGWTCPSRQVSVCPPQHTLQAGSQSCCGRESVTYNESFPLSSHLKSHKAGESRVCILEWQAVGLESSQQVWESMGEIGQPAHWVAWGKEEGH